ncbi:MAG: ubiquinone/menaquinone biosynthesis methyltransferase [Deltaproteobacteria bacterium]|nr:ubiquinone/menaquinone biosynthesis methyltransferase [Deltaproteobacteria bacterium]
MTREPETSPGSLRTDPEQVRVIRHIFGTVTGTYDLLNHVLSLRRDVAWRRKTVSEMRFFRTHRLLDVATGTCDLAIEAAQKHPHIRVVGTDLVGEMMERGRAKIRRAGLSSRIQLIQGDALGLPFADGRFDAAAVAFGIRNMPDREAALREMARVVVPGGLVLVLEMTLPRSRIFRPLYEIYLNRILPGVARLFSPNPGAYHYLARSIMSFPSPAAFAGLMRGAGLERVEVHPLTLGITSLHTGRKP